MGILEDLTVLYIENDLQVRKENSLMMSENGIRVLESDDLTEARTLLNHHTIDLIVLDLNLHKKDRIDFIRFLRDKNIMTPIVITADDSEKEVLLEIINLDTSHYLLKPFASSELLSILQIAAKKILNNINLKNIDLLHGFTYDPLNKSVDHPDGTTVQLTKKEFLLLELLLKNNRNCIPYETIEQHVWKEGIMSSDALRTMIHSLRLKTYSKLIINNSDLGYKIDL